MYTNLDDVYGKRQLSAEGVTLSGVRRGFPQVTRNRVRT